MRKILKKLIEGKRNQIIKENIAPKKMCFLGIILSKQGENSFLH